MAVGAAILCSGCGPRFDRGAMLEGIGASVILPAHDALVEAASDLDAAALAFAREPSEEGLSELRDRWLTADLAWRGVQLFQFEGLLLLHNAIEKRPARADFIEGIIAERRTGARGPVDADFIEGVGATSKGLGAIEYLIFPMTAESPEAVSVSAAEATEAFRDAARSEYLLALTENLARKTLDLRDHWAPTGEDYLGTFVENDSDGADVQGSISRLSNRLIEMHETATQQWLGRPTGRTTDGIARAEDVEAPLSGRSLELLIASEESVEGTFHAGLDDYLRHLDRRPGSEPLADRISAQFEVALGALRAIEGPLQEAVIERPVQTEAAYEEMRALIFLLKTEMAARLGITVTFSDSDGD